MTTTNDDDDDDDERSLHTSSPVFSLPLMLSPANCPSKMLYDQTLLLCDDQPQDTPHCALFFFFFLSLAFGPASQLCRLKPGTSPGALASEGGPG